MLPARPVRFRVVSAGGLMQDDVLVVSQGFNALARPLAGVKKYEQKFDVWDRHGTPVGHIEPTFKDTAASKLFRFVFAVVFTSSTARNSLDYRLVDKLGNVELALEIRNQVLYVKNAAGELIGSVMNTSNPSELKAVFYAEAPARRLFQKDPPTIAALNDKVDRPPYSYELKRPDGAVFARVTNPERDGRRNTLEIVDGSDPRLRALALGFSCGLVDRVWFQIPQAVGPT